jgi:2-succinyl-5-enolpyruvyl-6-hydroxy-3-cyclohexene-1-carboxylate synthase
VPLLVLTADRPPELHGVGAPQTIDQHELFGEMVRRFEDPGVARADDASTWRDLAQRLWASATQETTELPSPGPRSLSRSSLKRANSRRPHPRRRRQSLTRVR